MTRATGEGLAVPTKNGSHKGSALRGQLSFLPSHEWDGTGLQKGFYERMQGYPQVRI